jgi:hypothetical protein
VGNRLTLLRNQFDTPRHRDHNGKTLFPSWVIVARGTCRSYPHEQLPPDGPGVGRLHSNHASSVWASSCVITILQCFRIHEICFSNPVRNTCKIRSAFVIARSSSGELTRSTCISVNRRSMAALAASRQHGNFLSSVSKRAISYSPVQTYCFTVAPLLIPPLGNATPSSVPIFGPFTAVDPLGKLC